MYLLANVPCKKKQDLYFEEQLKFTSGVVTVFTTPCLFTFSAVIKYDCTRNLQSVKPSEVQRGVLEDLDEEDERLPL